MCILAFLHALLTNAPEDLRREEPAEIAGAGRGQPFDVDAADGAFLEGYRMPRADEAGGQLADPWFVTDERDALALRVLLELGQDGGDGSPGRQRFGRHDVRMRIETGGDNLGRLPRADEGAGDDHVDDDAEELQRAGGLAQLRHPILRQRPLRVVGP